jgi:ferrochelatase
MTKKGFLLINLGTPNSPQLKDVKSYLKTFLMDERVINLPKLIRFILVYGIIVPFRSKKTTHAYQQIWTKDGSPLAFLTQKLIQQLQSNVSKDIKIAYAMRYGNPSIASTLKSLQSCDEITILPLYPQYASATTGSSLIEVFDFFKTQEIIPSIKIIRDFFQHPAFIEALAASISPFLKPDQHLLLSYHGLPENQLHKIGCHPVCQGECPKELISGKACYKQQCYLGSIHIATKLKRSPEDYSISFQSRLGKTPWIKPYTDATLEKLAQRGIKKLAIACPSFVTDCLETLEEIAIQCKAQWYELGGEEFQFIPCLNDQQNWIDALKNILAL